MPRAFEKLYTGNYETQRMQEFTEKVLTLILRKELLDYEIVPLNARTWAEIIGSNMPSSHQNIKYFISLGSTLHDDTKTCKLRHLA